MIDFLWLKSFTEIIQLFLSVCFLIFLKIKYNSNSKIIKWLSIFFYIKLITDLYGILNYTSWISSILTKPVLEFYRVTMGSLELGMLTSFFIFTYSAYKEEISLKQGIPYFSISFLLLPLNIFLKYTFNSNLLFVFYTVKILWLVALLYLILYFIKDKVLKLFTISMIIWNTLWLTEVILHQQVRLIESSSSWIIFVFSELTFSIGIAYFFIETVTNPKFLKFEKIYDIMPNSLSKMIKENLDKTFTKDKLYLTSDLNLNTLANKINVSSSDLTIYLNKILNKNFNQFITDYRIEESKSLLSSSKENKLNIEQIMYASGFNSKSVFNTAFKHRTGMTPSEYKKQKEQP